MTRLVVGSCFGLLVLFILYWEWAGREVIERSGRRRRPMDR